MVVINKLFLYVINVLKNLIILHFIYLVYNSSNTLYLSFFLYLYLEKICLVQETVPSQGSALALRNSYIVLNRQYV